MTRPELPRPLEGRGSARVVALGGGHGLSASLRALTLLTDQLTAVVTVADDGGSSGRLREELGVLPPGDLRMALAALTDDDPTSRQWEALLQHRFPGDGPLGGHAAGNLLLAALAETAGGIVPALELAGRLVGARGRVLPMSCEPLRIEADVVGADPAAPHEVTTVVGQVAVATTTGALRELRLLPPDPTACAEAVAAVLAADVVVLGPGSWFTSVLTHLLVPDLRAALVQTSARRVVVLNLAPQVGETDGFSPEAHLEVLAAHAPELVLDVVLADETAVLDSRGLMAFVESAGGQLVLAPVGAGDGLPLHDPGRLARALAPIVGGTAWP